MKITLCGSIAFYPEMLAAQKSLESLGHEVKLPPATVTAADGTQMPVTEYYRVRKAAGRADTEIWDMKEKAIRAHFNKVAWADGILVLNYDKNSIPGYVGANTLMEIGLAFHLNKKIYFYKPIPEMSYSEELRGTKPIVINENLSKI